MADRREFIKLDVGYLSNPKVVALLVAGKPHAVLFHVECMGYSRQHRTDGVVPIAAAMGAVIGCKRRDVQAAVDIGLLVDNTDGSVTVHDYLEHQQSRAEIEAQSAAGRKGAEARWGNA